MEELSPPESGRIVPAPGLPNNKRIRARGQSEIWRVAASLPGAEGGSTRRIHQPRRAGAPRSACRGLEGVKTVANRG